MSRIGKNPIHIPEQTEVAVGDGVVTVKGPLGELSRSFRDDVSVAVEDGSVQVAPMRDTISAQALWGTYASHVRNMIAGVNEPFVKRLIIEGVGFRASLSGDMLTLSLGFSHPVEVRVPSGITVVVEKNVVTISGIDKEHVGQFAAKIRSYKKPEPYKGKGIRYEGEVVRRKQGKKTK